MKKLLSTLAIVALMAPIASAQLDPDPDGVGIYFDLGGNVNCDVAPVGAPLDTYLLLTNASAAAGVFGWECRIDYTPGVYILAWTLQGSAINAGTIPEFAVGIAVPLPWQPAIHLMTITVGVFAPDPIELWIFPLYLPSIPGVPCYADGADPGNLIEMRQSTGGPPLGDPPVCVINGDCPDPIPTEDATWGSVKNLYR